MAVVSVLKYYTKDKKLIKIFKKEKELKADRVYGKYYAIT